MSEGIARVSLADLGEQPVRSPKRAVELHSEAMERFSPASPDYGLALVNEGTVRLELAELGVEPRPTPIGVRL